MRHRLACTALLTLLAIVLTPASSAAQDDDANALSRVRRTSIDSGRLLDELVARSPTGRGLVDQLGRSDLIVYVRCQWFQTLMLRGRIGILASAGHRRLFAIEINSHQARTEQLAALAHELQHALEIAAAPSVRDARSLAALYQAIGQPAGYPGAETFETAAAADIGHRVRHELTAQAAADAPTLRQ
jgi:hypothetical protein